MEEGRSQGRMSPWEPLPARCPPDHLAPPSPPRGSGQPHAWHTARKQHLLKPTHNPNLGASASAEAPLPGLLRLWTRSRPCPPPPAKQGQWKSLRWLFVLKEELGNQPHMHGLPLCQCVTCRNWTLRFLISEWKYYKKRNAAS